MNLKIIFTFAVLAFVNVNAKLCIKERVKYCKGWLLPIYLVSPSYTGYMYSVCLGVERVNHCLHSVAKECREIVEIDQEIKETRQKLLPIEEVCLKKDPEVPEKMQQCARSIQTELNRCVTDSVDEVLGRKIAEHSLDKMRCTIYNFVFKCIVQKDEESCGKEAGQAALELMFDLPEEIQENCGYTVVNGTLRELAYDTVTERAETHISLSPSIYSEEKVQVLDDNHSERPPLLK